MLSEQKAIMHVPRDYHVCLLYTSRPNFKVLKFLDLVGDGIAKECLALFRVTD